MHIEIWSDFVCPFCFIGKRKFDAALESFEHQEDVTVEFKSFQLDPNTPKYHGQKYYDSLAKKFGSVEQVKQMTNNIISQAKTVGLDFDFENAKPANTFDAHRLNKYAQEQNNNQVADALFHAHFTAGKDIGDMETLLQIAADSGLKKEVAHKMLHDPEKFKSVVETDLQEAQQFGVTGVPYFIINRKYAISGAQPEEAFKQALEQVWKEENENSPLEDLSANSTNVCTDDVCAVPTEQDKKD